MEDGKTQKIINQTYRRVEFGGRVENGVEYD